MSVRDVVAGWAEMQAALPGYEKAEAMYDGTVGEVFASSRVRAELTRTGQRYRFNLAKTPVDTLAARVELVAVTAPDNPTANQRIEAVHDANDLDVHYPEWVRMALEYGDAYLQVWPVVDEADPEPGDAAPDEELVDAQVELIVHNPKHCRVIYDPENQRRKWYAMKRWEVPGPSGSRLWRVDLYYAEAIERWVSKPGAKFDDASGWAMFLEDDEAPDNWLLENPYGAIPFFHLRTGLPYGKPVHADVYGAQDALNKTLITMVCTLDSQGWKERYRLLEKGAELDQADDGTGWDDDADADDSPLTAGGMSTARSGGPGTTTTYPDTKAMGEFSAADPEVFLKPAEFIIKLAAQLSTTPLHYFDPSGDVPSGESLKVADAPLVKKAERMITLFKSPVVEAWLFILNGVMQLGVERVDTRWAPVESATGLDDWQVVDAKLKAGVPQAQALVEAGYDTEQVATWLDEEAEAMDLARRVDLLGKIGEAMQALGTAVGLGVVDQASVSAIVERVLGQAAPDDAT